MAPRYLIDTDIFIHLRQQRLPQVRARFDRLQSGEAAISAIVYGELLYGAEKSATPKKALKGVEDLVSLVPVEPLGDGVAREYGALRATLEKRGDTIGNNDMWIAAHALSLGLILVTANEREFKRVPGLKVQNWVNV
jgi:tRNA(fMet)-specific endonuclease VapC